MFALGSLTGWRTAALAMGLAGLVLAAVLFALRNELKPYDEERFRMQASSGHDAGTAIAMLLQSRMIVFLLFFFVFAFATIGLQNFTAIALAPVTGLPLLATKVVLTGFLIASPVGILIGGWLADAVPRHGMIATVGFVLAGLLVVGVPSLALPAPLLVAGFAAAGLFLGIALPSRDLVVRAASPPGASGKVFGFVYSGLDAGASLGPTLFGLLVSKGQPHAVFLTAAGLLMTGALIIHLPALFARCRAGTSGR
jgi:predicted MFS family arabinose efflux permease